jgi:hypothetical protein
MKRIITALAALTLTLSASAQIEDQIEIGHACSMFGEEVPETVTLFESDEEVESVIRDIVSASGLVKNFVIRAGGVPNAAATIRGTDRYILYEPYFMRNVRAQTGTKWAAISIMAHEVGHHLNGHTLTPGGSRPKSELEADYFSGFVLQRMGASLDDARMAMKTIGSPVASETHPAKHDRLVAITQGWSKACEKDSSCKDARPAESSVSEPQPRPIPNPNPLPGTSSPPSPSPQPVGFPSGHPTSACGCWGYVSPGATRQNPYCASGFDTPVPCAGLCYGGGAPWQSVCR